MSRDQRVSVAAGTELIIGQNCFHHADFCWKMAKICMIATSQMPGSIIKLSQYYHTYHHTDTTQPANMQKSPVPHIVKAAHLHDDLQYWNLFLVPLWCGCWVASWRGYVVLKHSPVCHNPFITITDTAAAAAIIATIYFILTVRWNTPEICVQFDVFYGFYFV